VGKVALAVNLLTGTGLRSKGWRDAARASPGFVPQNLLTLLPHQILRPSKGRFTAEDALRFERDMSFYIPAKQLRFMDIISERDPKL